MAKRNFQEVTILKQCNVDGNLLKVGDFVKLPVEIAEIYRRTNKLVFGKLDAKKLKKSGIKIVEVETRDQVAEKAQEKIDKDLEADAKKIAKEDKSALNAWGDKFKNDNVV